MLHQHVVVFDSKVNRARTGFCSRRLWGDPIAAMTKLGRGSKFETRIRSFPSISTPPPITNPSPSASV